MFQNANMYHYVNYYPDPSGVVMNVTTDAQLVGADDDGNTEIKTGLTRVQALIGDDDTEVDGAFTITFNTNINATTNDANVVLHTALNAINSDDNAEAIARFH